MNVLNNHDINKYNISICSVTPGMYELYVVLDQSVDSARFLASWWAQECGHKRKVQSSKAP